MNETQQEIQQLMLELNEAKTKTRYHLFALVVTIVSFIGFITSIIGNRPDISLAWMIMQGLCLLLMINNRSTPEELDAILKKLKRLEELQNREQ